MKRDYIENIEGGERRMVDIPLELRKEDGAEYFAGTAVPFGQVTDLGYFTEEITRSAFDDVMQDDVRALFNHDPDVVLGRNKSGTLKLTVDDKGVHYRALYNPNDPDHVRVMEKVKRGDVSQSSYAFTVKDETWGKRDGKPHREITKVQRWYDVAPVTYPANPNTSVGKRSLESFNEKENNKKKSDETVEAKKRMIQMEIDLISLGITNF